MSLATGPGSNDGAMRAGSISAVATVGNSVRARLSSGAAGPGVFGAIDIVGVLLLVGLLLIGLLLISAGCGPPN